MRNTKKNDNFSKGLFYTIPSEIGKLIGHDFSPAVFNDEKMRRADLSYVISDKSRVIHILSQKSGDYISVKRALEQFYNGKILFFHCIEGTLSKEEICDFFNKVCTLVPFKLHPDDMEELGTIAYSRGVEDGIKHTYWGVDIDKYEPSNKKTSKDGENIESEIKYAFEKILDASEKFKLADVSLKYVKKEDLEKYFKRDKSALNKLENDVSYLVVFAHGNNINEDDVQNIANEIGKKFGWKNMYSQDDVIKLGVIRKKYKNSQFFDDYDVFAVKFG